MTNTSYEARLVIAITLIVSVGILPALVAVVLLWAE